MQKLVLQTAISLTAAKHDVVIYARQVDKGTCYPELSTTVTLMAAPPELSDLSAAQWFATQVSSADLLIVHDVATLPAVAFLPSPTSVSVLWMLNHQYRDGDFSTARQVASAVRRKQVDVASSHLARAITGYRRARLRRAGADCVDIAATYDLRNAEAVRARRRIMAKVVYAAADLDDYAKLSSAHPVSTDVQDPGVATILSVGVVLPHRRYEDLIDAIAMPGLANKPVNVVIAGSTDVAPDYTAKLVRLIRKHALQDRVRITGAVSDTDMKDLYRKASIFVFVNDGHTWGISIFEALAARLPVIITNNIGATDLISEGPHARFVPPKDPQRIAEAISEMLTQSDQRDSCLDLAYSAIAQTLTWDKYAERLLEAATSARLKKVPVRPPYS